MDPVFARNRLSAFLDGELPASERAAVAAALAEDPALAQAFARLERVRERLAPLRREEAPPEARASLRAMRRPAPSAVLTWGPSARRALQGLLDGGLVVFAVLGLRAGIRALLVPEHPLAQTGKAAVTDALPSATARATGADASPEATEATEVTASAAPELEALPRDRYGGRPPGTAPHLGSATQRGTGNPAVPPPQGVVLARARGGEREAYAPDWERGTEESGSASAELSLDSSDERVLFALEGLVRELGGNLQDGRGKRRAAFVMSPGDRSEVVVIVPTYNLTALVGRLGTLGELQTHRDPSVNGNPATASVRLSVRLPG